MSHYSTVNISIRKWVENSAKSKIIDYVRDNEALYNVGTKEDRNGPVRASLDGRFSTSPLFLRKRRYKLLDVVDQVKS